jgi:hypothetical protein
MAQSLQIVFPKGTEEKAAEELAGHLARVEGVRGAGMEEHRAIDPASLTAWVSLAGALLPVISSIVDMVRGKRMKGVKIKVGDKTIDVDEASAADLERLLRAKP